ncbi:pyridoxal phosphate-dependent aminotransferase [Pontibacter sp. G13]|uniref:pyridoxal phosphate-dependent aminotransferase n=1 Tax=Pontibacter sp. G13 TaxID=3074898 RepID=UPI002889E2B3|nr:pyridoxal phosphate-dependent aminotransferase [Pontibacter sp. G13]WNJ17591.1 pyridoxal phosphate-dependent aminotransferase [Pontibacter sp. G13]
MQYSQLISSMEESATLGIAKKVRALKAEGRDIIGLTLGEPDFDTPEHIREAAKQALDKGFTHYPPVTGYPALREAIVAKLKRDNGLDYAADQIVVSTGAKQSLYNVVLAMLNPGDHAILIAPYWVSYRAMLHLAQAEVTEIETDIAAAYKVTPEQLEAAIKPNTRLLFLNTPSNPTGSMYSREELEALVEVLERHPQVYVISDEIYEYITFGMEHVSLGTLGNMFDRTITVNGFSKGFAMTGWRLGYIAAPREIAKLTEKLQGQSTSGANAFAQQGAIAAMTGGMESVNAMRDEFLKRRDMLFADLKAIEGLEVILPDGAFYFYPDLKNFLGKTTPAGQKLTDINELCLYLIEEEGLALVPGAAFGTKSHVRLSYAYSEQELKEAAKRLGSGLGKLS